MRRASFYLLLLWLNGCGDSTGIGYHSHTLVIGPAAGSRLLLELDEPSASATLTPTATPTPNARLPFDDEHGADDD